MLPKYERVALIGEGSFGQVYKYGRIKDSDKDQPEFLAMKFMSKSQKGFDLKAFKNECEIQMQMEHENIVQAREMQENPSQLILITEFIDGGNLATLMEAHPQGLGEEKIKALAIDLFCALHYLHRNRVLHRDLKPQNVLIEKTTGKAKLADFGFARNLGQASLVVTSIKGTPLYMAPELIEEKPYDFKADLWSG